MLTVTYHAGHEGHPRVATVDAEIGTDHDTLAAIIAVYLTGDRETRHVLTIDSVEPVETIVEAIPVTGQRARVSNSIIAGQPRVEFEVDVVEIDGDVLTYRSSDGYWKSTARRSAISDWYLISNEVSAYAAELRERHDRIAAGLTAFRAVSPFEGMTPARLGATDTAMMEARDHVWGMYQDEVAKVVGR